MGALGPFHTLQGSSKPSHPSRCLSKVASGVYLLMNALQLCNPLLLSELMSNETGSNREKWEEKKLKLSSLSTVEINMGFWQSSGCFSLWLRWDVPKEMPVNNQMIAEWRYWGLLGVHEDFEIFKPPRPLLGFRSASHSSGALKADRPGFRCELCHLEACETVRKLTMSLVSPLQRISVMTE